jgi:hypothetical protein
MKASRPMVVACLALFVALSGTAVAASGLITSAQIKDHTIKPVDLSGAAISSLKGKKGATGPRGPTGLTGATGATGPQGAAAIPVGFTKHLNTVVVAASGVASLTASCSPGTYAVSGGFQFPGLVAQSAPTPANDGWTVVVANIDNVNAYTLTAYAICTSGATVMKPIPSVAPISEAQLRRALPALHHS